MKTEDSVCIGCGHLKSDPIGKLRKTCCPDSDYIPLREYLKRSQALDYRF